MKKNILLLFSTAGAIFLFALPSRIMLLLEAAIFLTVVLAIRLGYTAKRHNLTVGTALLTGLFTGIGIYYFLSTPKGFDPPIAFAIVCGITSYYAFYCLANRIDEWVCGILQISTDSRTFDKWKTNWLFSASAVAFFFLETGKQPNPGYLCSTLAAVGISAVIASRAPSLLAKCAADPWPQKCLYVLSAIGISLFQTVKFLAAFPRQVFLGGFCGLSSLFFVYICVSALYGRLGMILSSVFADIRVSEIALYGAMLLVSLCILTVCFLKTDAFYGTDCPYDIIYTSDSPTLVRGNAYLCLTHDENDLRQPLFAVFSAPFLGLPFLIGRMLGASPAVNALLLNYPQVLLLFTANYLLAGILKLTGGRRMVFMLLCWLSYPTMLFSLMMEQYIIAYFYLILLIDSSCEKKPDPVALCGAAGTMLTSAALLPLMSEKHPIQEFAAWFQDMLNAGIGLIIAILAFARLDVLWGIADGILNLNRFSGESLPILDRFYQYTVFIFGCLFAPAGESRANMWGNISWQLAPANGICAAGTVLLALSILGAVLNWEKKICRISLFWITFSFLTLVGYGWGTQENGLILYSLYFGWPIWVLLYQLAGKVESHWKVKHLTVSAGLAVAASMAVINIPAIVRIISFAILNYPV